MSTSQRASATRSSTSRRSKKRQDQENQPARGDGESAGPDDADKITNAGEM